MSLTKIIKEYRKEFEENFGEDTDQLVSAHNGWIQTELLSHQTNLLLALSEARVEKMRGMVRECRHKRNWDGKTQIQPCSCVLEEVGGHNSALQTLIKEEEDFIKFLKGEEK